MNQTFKKLSAKGIAYLHGSMDWLFPRVCFGCQSLHQPEKIPNLCNFCWMKIHSPQHLKFKDNRVDIYSAGVYEGSLKKIVTQAKFKRNVICADFSLELLHSTLLRIPYKFDCCISIPADYWRSFLRGLDLPGTMAREISTRIGIEYRTGWLKKGRYLESQRLLNLEQRNKNMKNAFEASPEIRDKTILVIDDIMTSGSTIKACYKALKRHNPHRVVFLTIAKTPF